MPRWAIRGKQVMVTRPSNRNADAVEEGSDHKNKPDGPTFVFTLRGPHTRNRDRLPLTTVKHQRGEGTIPGGPSAIVPLSITERVSFGSTKIRFAVPERTPDLAVRLAEPHSHPCCF